MCLLLETICIKEGKLLHIDWHNRRFNASRSKLFGCGKPLLLEHEIPLPALERNVIYKCRVIYSAEIESVEFFPYRQPTIKTLKTVYDDYIQYENKYSDRTCFEKLLGENSGYDDILIVKQGHVTDTSFSNIVFFEGKKWYTPAKPLLFGTCRARLLEEKRIGEKNIRPADLIHYKEARLINAMNDLDEAIIIRIEDIHL